MAWLKKFRYETRQSATDFCETLIDEVRDYLLEGVIDDILDGKASLAAEISGHPKYMPSYDSDPTIESMLNVLERIDAIYKAEPIPDLWTRLMDGDNIRFYALSLDKFGLSDDLYIKMNSRGKKLTPFEIFKSDCFFQRIYRNIISARFIGNKNIRKHKCNEFTAGFDIYCFCF